MTSVHLGFYMIFLLSVQICSPRLCNQRINCQWGPFGDWSECDGCTKSQVRIRITRILFSSIFRLLYLFPFPPACCRLEAESWLFMLSLEATPAKEDGVKPDPAKQRKAAPYRTDAETDFVVDRVRIQPL